MNTTEPTNALATTDREERGLTFKTVSEMTGYTLAEISLLRNTVAKDAPLVELAVFLHACKTLQLDPLLRQAYWIRRKNRELIDGEWQDVYKGALQVGIDGFRAIADRTGVYGGSAEPRFPDGYQVWKYRKNDRSAWEDIVVPVKAEVTVWKIVQGRNCPFTGVAYWDEFVPPLNQAQMYAKMPRLMLAKDAEAQALRKAFPALLGPVDYGNTLAPGATEVIEERPPERAAAPAPTYEQIMGPDDRHTFYDLPESAGPAPAADVQERAVVEPPPSSSARPAPDERAALWDEHRRLSQRAVELGLTDEPTVNTRASAETLRNVNQSLAGRIRNLELDQRLEAQQEQERSGERLI